MGCWLATQCLGFLDWVFGLGAQHGVSFRDLG